MLNDNQPAPQGARLQDFLYYLGLGWSVIPVKYRDKHPLWQVLPKDATGKSVWRPFSERQPSEDEVRIWAAYNHPKNIGVVLGEVSNAVVLDIDTSDAGWQWLRSKNGGEVPRTPRAKTSKGWHFYFLHPGEPVGGKVRATDENGTRWEIGDLKADGGYVVAPPSVHETGAVYTWEVHPDDVPLDELPDWLLEHMQQTLQPRFTGEAPTPSAEMPTDYYTAIATELGVQGYQNTGWSHAVACPFVAHEHDHHKPAAFWHADKKILRCFKCDQVWLSKDVAHQIGVDWKAFQPELTTEEKIAYATAGQPRPEDLMQPPPEPNGDAMDPATVLAGGPPPAPELTPHDHMAELGNLMSRIAQEQNGKRGTLARQAISHLVHLDVFDQEFYRKELAQAAGLSVSAINRMMKATDDPEPVPVDDETAYYWEHKGGIYRGNRDDISTWRRIARFTAHYTKENWLDYGDGNPPQLMTELEICLPDGRVALARVPAEDTGDAQKLIKIIRGAAGVAATVEALESRHLGPALDTLSAGQEVERVREIVHTGWVKVGDSWAFITPGGTVGDLPEGNEIRLENRYSRYAVLDGGDELFQMGVQAWWKLLDSFAPELTYPAVAFAFLAPLGRFIHNPKFVLHFVGRTGTLKTSYAQTLLSLFGDWAHSPSPIMWEGTVNSIEVMGFPLKDVVAVVDDYKPEVNSKNQVVSFIQRYASETGRSRLNRSSSLMDDRPFRAWMLSTGEDLPTNVASVLARTISLRFTPREPGQPMNDTLADAQRMAAGLPTVMARYITWLAANANSKRLLAELVTLRAAVVAEIAQIDQDTPNRDRIAENIAALVLAWRQMAKFLQSCGAVSGLEAEAFLAFDVRESGVGYLVKRLAAQAATGIVAEKPTQRFLHTVEALIDKGFVKVAPRGESHTEWSQNTQAWVDAVTHQVYLHSGIYDDVERWLQQSRQTLNSSRQELYKLLYEEGITTHAGTKVVKLGGKSIRVLTVKAGVMNITTDDGGDEDDPIVI